MNLPNEDGKINFLIAIHVNFANALTGGIVAMHKLGYMLAERGHNVFLMCEPEYKHPNIRVIPSRNVGTEGQFINKYQWDPFYYPLDKTVSIYPQITTGNQFNTNHVARWILYDTEKVIEDTWGENDVYFNFGTFKTYRTVPYRRLTTFHYYRDRLYQTNFGRRKGFCHIIHKHTPPGGEKLFEELGSFDLSNWKTLGNYDYLREKLNEYTYMVTYDQKSFYTLAAGLCGCQSIIAKPGPTYEFSPNANSDFPDEVLSPVQYRAKNPIAMCGVAYGLDDIDWAKRTIDLVPSLVSQLEEDDNKTVDRFVEFWEKKIFGR